MADGEKQNSTVDSKKKNSSFDDDFGKDFLSFWEPSKKGKDKIDFDVKEVPQNKKKSFNFDKFDDFELGGNFDKLPSFKFDMPDLDFNSPVIKTDKPTEKNKGKQESKQEKFTFNFDISELGGFDLDCSPVTGEKNPSKVADGNASDCSFKHACDQDLKSNSGTSTDAFKDQKSTKSTSRAEVVVQTSTSEGTRLSISQDLGHNDGSHNVSISTVRQIAEEEEKHETHSNETHKDQPQAITDPNTEKSLQDSIHQSVSGNCPARQYLPEVLVRPSSSNVVKDYSSREGESSMRTVESSQSRNSSPVNSYKRRCSPDTNLSEPPNGSGDFQKHCQRNLDEVSRGIEPKSGSIQDNQNSESKLIPSLVQRDSRSCKPMSLNEKVTASLQLKSLNKPAGNVSQRTSPETKKQFDFIHNNKLKTMNVCQVDDNRDSKVDKTMAMKERIAALQNKPISKSASHVPVAATQNEDDSLHNCKLKTLNVNPVNDNSEAKKINEQAETQKIGILKLNDKGSTKGISVNSISKRNDMCNEPSGFQKTATLQQQLTANNMPKSIIANLVSSTSSEKSSMIIPVEIKGSSIKDDKTFDRLMLPRTQNFATAKETKLVGIFEGTSDSQLSPELLSFQKTATLQQQLTANNTPESIIPDLVSSIASKKSSKIVPVEIKGSSTKDDKTFDSSLTLPSFQKTARLQQQLAANNTPKSIIANLVSNFASKRSAKIVPVEIKGSSTKDDKAFDSSVTLPMTQNFTTAKETKLVGIFEGSSDSQLRASSKMADPVHTERTASINNSLKRKTYEDSLVHLESSNPLKCIKESSIERKPFEFSPKVERAVVPIIENLEIYHADDCSEDLTSKGVPELEASRSNEGVTPRDKDEIVEQAEVWVKELDDMSILMRKNHDEAKDLLVRAIVNHNELLMLNHPLYEEKIRSLQRFANTLQHKRF